MKDTFLLRTSLLLNDSKNSTIMDDPIVKQLLADLHSDDEQVRTNATQDLWYTWFNQKGAHGLDLLRRSQMAYETGDVEGAEMMLSALIENQPDFAEAWNRRAVLHYTKGSYRDSLQDCKTVIRLNPYHFGAWHGMGLCYAALGNYYDAIQSFRKALEIQPYAIVNQKLILECTARLN